MTSVHSEKKMLRLKKTEKQMKIRKKLLMKEMKQTHHSMMMSLKMLQSEVAVLLSGVLMEKLVRKPKQEKMDQPSPALLTKQPTAVVWQWQSLPIVVAAAVVEQPVLTRDMDSLSLNQQLIEVKKQWQQPIVLQLNWSLTDQRNVDVEEDHAQSELECLVRHAWGLFVCVWLLKSSV